MSKSKKREPVIIHKDINAVSSIEEYRANRIETLEEFGVIITPEIEREMNRRKTEISIDQYYHSLLNAKYDC